MRFIVRPAAAADMDEAFLWYEGNWAGLGNEFLEAAQAMIDVIAEYPLRYAVMRRNTMRAFLRRFPYGIYHRIYDAIVVVVA